jgi:hypothetical protein
MEKLSIKQTIDRLESLPVCEKYVGTDCGPWCHCRIQDDSLEILRTIEGDILSLLIAAFVCGATSVGVIWLLWTIPF